MANFQLHLYHGKKSLIFDEIIMMSTLYLTNMFTWIFIVLAHWNNMYSPLVDMSLKSDTLSKLWANQSLLSPECCMPTFVAEKQKLTALLSLVWSDCGWNSQSTILKVSMLIITPPMWLNLWRGVMFKDVMWNCEMLMCDGNITSFLEKCLSHGLIFFFVNSFYYNTHSVNLLIASHKPICFIFVSISIFFG